MVTYPAQAGTGRGGGERTALYRIYGAADLLLYVGISKSFGQRWSSEAREMPWWHQIQRQTVDWYPSREDAEAAEKAAIKAERPKYNIQHAERPAGQSARWRERDMWVPLDLGDDPQVDVESARALLFDADLSPAGWKLAMFRLLGYTSVEAVEATGMSKSTFYYGLRELHMGGYL